MSDAYRAPAGEAVARVKGGNLVVPDGATMPPLCIVCGGPEQLATKTQRFTMRPFAHGLVPLLFLLIVPILGLLLLKLTRGAARSATITYSLCTRCEERAGSVAYAQAGIKIGWAVGLVAAAAAAFNGAGLVGVSIVAACVSVTVLAHRRFIRGRRFVALLSPDGGLLLRGVHGNVARAALERRLAPPTVNRRD